MHIDPRFTLSIEAIDRELEAGFNHLRFTPEIEIQYEADTKEDRNDQLMVTSLIGLILYDVFLVSDWQMIGDVFREAVISRLVIFTPITLAALFLLSRRPPLIIREGVAALHGIFCAILILWLFAISKSPERFSYHYGTLIIMMFVGLFQCIHFYFSVISIF